jgi:hypothetical protein
MSPLIKAGITTAKDLLDLPGGQYCHKSEESMSLPEEAMSSPEEAISSPEKAMGSPEEALSSPKQAGITAAKGLLDLPGGQYYMPLEISPNDT